MHDRIVGLRLFVNEIMQPWTDDLSSIKYFKIQEALSQIRLQYQIWLFSYTQGFEIMLCFNICQTLQQGLYKLMKLGVLVYRKHVFNMHQILCRRCFYLRNSINFFLLVQEKFCWFHTLSQLRITSAGFITESMLKTSSVCRTKNTFNDMVCVELWRVVFLHE